MQKIHLPKLSDPERRVLSVTELDAELSATDIAKRCRLKTPSVHRILQKLRDEGVIVGRTAVVDTDRIGLVEYGIGITFGRVKREVLDAFFRYAERQPAISWVAEVGGGFDLCLNILVPRPQAALSVLMQIEQHFPGLIQEKSICIRTKRYRFWRGYLNGRASKTARFSIGLGNEILPVSQEDIKVLSVLAEARFETYRESARKLGMPIATFLRRIQSLKERKILLGFGYRMNLEAVGVHQFRILVFAESCSPETEKAMLAFVSECPWAKVFLTCLGPWSFELEVDVASQAEAREITAGIRKALSGSVSKVLLLPIFVHRKFISFPPNVEKSSR